VCVCVYVYLRVWVCVFACVRARSCVCACVCVRQFVYVFFRKWVCVCSCVFVRVYLCGDHNIMVCNCLHYICKVALLDGHMSKLVSIVDSLPHDLVGSQTLQTASAFRLTTRGGCGQQKTSSLSLSARTTAFEWFRMKVCNSNLLQTGSNKAKCTGRAAVQASISSLRLHLTSVDDC